MCEWLRRRNVDSALVFLLEDDVGRLLVYSDAKPFQLRFDDLLVGEGLVDVKHDEDQVALLGNGNHLPTPTLPVLCALDDSRKIQHLDLGAIVQNTTRDSRELRCCVSAAFCGLAWHR